MLLPELDVRLIVNGANLDDRVARIGRLGRDEAELDLAREPRLVGFETRDLLASEGGEFGFCRLGGEHRAVVGEVGEEFEIGLAAGDEFLEARIFAGEFLRLRRVVEDFRIAQQALHLGEASGEFVDVRTQVHACGERVAVQRKIISVKTAE